MLIKRKTWSVITCTDEREFCKYEVDYVWYDKKYETTRGCAIPEGLFSNNINIISVFPINLRYNFR